MSLSNADKIKIIIKDSLPPGYLAEAVCYDNWRVVVCIADIESERYKSLSGHEKITKLLAIESFRWFCKFPTFYQLELTVKTKAAIYHLSIDRFAIQREYGDCSQYIHDSGAAGIVLTDNWRKKFIKSYDTPPKRQAFVDKYVRISKHNCNKQSGKS